MILAQLTPTSRTAHVVLRHVATIVTTEGDGGGWVACSFAGVSSVSETFTRNSRDRSTRELVRVLGPHRGDTPDFIPDCCV
jgi:hypothetical protein